MMFPKPQRFIDEANLIAYREKHVTCEVGGCGAAPMPQPHHLRSRKSGRDDRDSNLLCLCWNHHIGNQGWHRHGGLEWYRRNRDCLTGEACAKVEAALRLTP